MLLYQKAKNKMKKEYSKTMSTFMTQILTPKKTPEAHHILTFLLLKYSPTKWPINTIYRIASSDAR